MEKQDAQAAYGLLRHQARADKHHGYAPPGAVLAPIVAVRMIPTRGTERHQVNTQCTTSAGMPQINANAR